MALLILGGVMLIKKPFQQKEELISDETVSESDTYISVYITGAVLKTGRYRVPASWTLYDLLELVGINKNADLDELNFGEALNDGQSYFISEKKSEITSNESRSLVNINKATIEELKTLEGIGDVLAYRIIEYRQSHPFNDIAEIQNVKGIKAYIYEQIKTKITV